MKRVFGLLAVSLQDTTCLVKILKHFDGSSLTVRLGSKIMGRFSASLRWLSSFLLFVRDKLSGRFHV